MAGRLEAIRAYLCLAVVLILAVFPIFWLVTSSFKTPSEWFTRPVVWLPQNPTPESYLRLFSVPGNFKAILNSILVATGGTLLAIAVGFPAAYSISRGVRAQRLFFALTAIPRLTPPVVFAIPMLVFYHSLGMLDTLYGLVLIYSAVTVFFVVWITKPFIDDIPVDVEEAALLDGMSRLGVLFKLILPMVKHGLAAAALIVFILNWTEFVLALTLTKINAHTIPVQLSLISYYDLGHRLGPVMALSSISLVPFVLVAFLLQKYLLRGLTWGVLRRR